MPHNDHRTGHFRAAAHAEHGNGVPGPRIALYSHDTQGLGHIRRNLLIAKALSEGGVSSSILLLSGLRETASYAMPSGVDCVTLPALGKDAAGEYYSRSLGVPMADLIQVRRDTIAAALTSFRPDVFIVDKVPLGAFNELTPCLEALAPRTRFVLGLREILDDPDVVRHEWQNGDYIRTIRQFYSRIWVYGDPAVFDTPVEYAFPADIRSMVRFTGYLNPTDVTSHYETPDGTIAGLSNLPAGETVLCLVGGGRDGLPLAEAFLRARRPDGTNAILVTGPLMPPDAVKSLRTMAGDDRRTRVLEFVTNPCPLLRLADHVIAMGGYNTMCEIQAYAKRALVVPRSHPRREQLIRARRFEERGYVDVLPDVELNPDAISNWLRQAPTRPRVARPFDFDGIARLPVLLDELLTTDLHSSEPTHVAG